MGRHSTSSADEKIKVVLWGGELNQEKRACTFKPHVDKKENCKLLLTAVCLGEKAKEEVNRVEILPSANQEDKKMQPVTIASLKASVLPMVTMSGLELSPPVMFYLRAGSGPVFLSGQEYYETSDLVPWDEEDEEEEGEEEEEEEDDDDEEEEEVDVSLEDTPNKQVKRLASHQKQASIAKKKKLEKDEEETVRSRDKSPGKKVKSTPKPKKLMSKK